MGRGSRRESRCSPLAITLRYYCLHVRHNVDTQSCPSSWLVSRHAQCKTCPQQLSPITAPLVSPSNTYVPPPLLVVFASGNRQQPEAASPTYKTSGNAQREHLHYPQSPDRLSYRRMSCPWLGHRTRQLRVCHRPTCLRRPYGYGLLISFAVSVAHVSSPFSRWMATSPAGSR